MDRSHVVQDTENWWAVVYTVLNLQVPLNAGNFLST